jgi:hypothetical protein
MPSQKPSTQIRRLSEQERVSLHPSLRNPGDVEPNWPYFVSFSGEDGFRWAQEYGVRKHADLMEGITRALGLLRRRQIDAGLAELRRAEEGLAEIEMESPVFFHVLGRWYFGAIAYYYYCIEDFDRACAALDEAHAAVQRAIEIRSFLVPFAAHCHDFWIQRIRIDRNRRRWSDMWRSIEVARQIEVGEKPYCVLSDGTPIDIAAIQGFYNSLAPFTEAEREPLRVVLDDEVRLRFFRITLAEIYAMPGFVIPYRPAQRAKDA